MMIVLVSSICYLWYIWDKKDIRNAIMLCAADECL